MEAAAGSAAAKAGLDAESAQWLRRLGAEGREQEDASSDLHALLLRFARSQTARRGPAFHVTGPEIDDVAHQCAADAMMAITAKLAEFRGESRFTTWAFRFVLLEVANKLGRHFWRSADPVPDSIEWDRLPDRFGLDPVHENEARELVVALRQAVESVLTAQQRRLFVQIVLQGVPLDAVVAQQGSNRNAVYKSLFDARRKLRAALVADGYLTDPPPRQQ